VLSAKVSNSFDGLQVSTKPRFTYSACRGAPHWLFWGLASFSFEDMDRPPVKGEFVKTPEGCRVLLRGRRGPSTLVKARGSGIGFRGPIALDGAGPVAVEFKAGKGTIIATTLEPFDTKSAYAAEIMTLVLTNAGVRIEPPQKTAARVRALRTVPLKLDGRLDDWTNDVEDRSVSPYRHAEPVVLGADTVVRGDYELSGIVYFLWDEASLYVGGLVARSAYSQAEILIQIGQHQIALTPSDRGWKTKCTPPSLVAFRCFSEALRDVRQFVDARFLTFAEIDGRVGNVRPVLRPVPGRTFELRMPWKALRLQPEGAIPFAIELRQGDDVVLRVPTDAEGTTGTLVFAE